MKNRSAGAPMASLFCFMLLRAVRGTEERNISIWATATSKSVGVATTGRDRSTLPQPYDASCDWTKSDIHQVVVSLQVFLIVSSSFVCIGLLGNLASLVVFSSSEMRKISSSVYLLLLSVSDSVYLVCIFCTKTFNILRCWHISSLTHDLSNYSPVCCVLFQYFLDLTSDYSSCLILLFTLERFAAVYWPVRFKEMCTVRRARIAAGSTFAVVALSTGPPHPFLIRLYTDYNLCAISDIHGMIFYNLYILEMVVFRVLPALIISILNGFIMAKVAKIARMKRVRKQNKLGATGSCLQILARSRDGNNANRKIEGIEAPVKTTPTTADEKIQTKENTTQRTLADQSRNSIPTHQSIESTASHHQQQQQQQQKQHNVITRRQKLQMKRAEDRNLQLTIILILVSTTYIVAYLPTLIHFIINLMSYWRFLSLKDEIRMIARNYTDLLYVSAFATNFFLFTMSGRVFRQQMWKIVFRSKRFD